MTGLSAVRNFVAKRAVILIIASIGAADIGAAFDGPHWLCYLLAILILLFAVVLGSRRALPRLFLRSTEELGFSRNRDWLHYQIELKGTPRGYLLLSLVWFIGGVLTGLHFPYFAVVLSSGLLLAAWSGDRRQYPVDLVGPDSC